MKAVVNMKALPWDPLDHVLVLLPPTCLILVVPPMSELLAVTIIPTPDPALVTEALLVETQSSVKIPLSPIVWSMAALMSLLTFTMCSLTRLWISISTSWGSGPARS